MRKRVLVVFLAVAAFMLVASVAMAAEPSDYATEAGTFVSTMAGEVWPIALAVFTGLLGITLGIAVLRYILRRGRGLVAGH